jgi:hypothetical protein
MSYENTFIKKKKKKKTPKNALTNKTTLIS